VTLVIEVNHENGHLNIQAY